MCWAAAAAAAAGTHQPPHWAVELRAPGTEPPTGRTFAATVFSRVVAAAWTASSAVLLVIHDLPRAVPCLHRAFAMLRLTLSIR